MATFVSDSFTEAGDLTLASHTGEVGATWTKNSTNLWSVVGATDRVRANSTSFGFYTSSGTPASAEYDVQGTLTVVSHDGFGGPFGRGSITGTNNTDYSLLVDSAGTGGEGYFLFKSVAAVDTLLGSFITTPASGDVCKLELRDATKRMFINGTQRGSSVDNAITATGKAGICGATYAAPGNAVGYHWDDFTASDPVATTPPPATTFVMHRRAPYYVPARMY